MSKQYDGFGFGNAGKLEGSTGNDIPRPAIAVADSAEGRSVIRKFVPTPHIYRGKDMESPKAGNSTEQKRKVSGFVEEDSRGGMRVIPYLLALDYQKDHEYINVVNDGSGRTCLYLYNDGVYQPTAKKAVTNQLMDKVAAVDPKLVRQGLIREAYALLEMSREELHMEEVDTDESIINFQNGLLHVTGSDLVLTEHTPEVYSTVQLKCTWEGAEQPTPVFDEYFSTLTGGDEEVQELLLQYMGAVLSNVFGGRFKKSLYLVGPGNTGKSILRTLTENIVGKENCMTIDLQGLETRFGTGTICGKRLIGTGEMKVAPIRELKTFKMVTGGDSIMAELKGKQAFHMHFRGLSWFCMNSLPPFGGDQGDWVYDRIMIVRCDNVIPEEEQDKELVDKLYAERAGIVYKAIQALQRVIRNGYRFSEPESTKRYREAYKVENNTVLRFIEECMCERTEDDWKNAFTSEAVYRTYREWCTKNGYKSVRTAKQFRDTVAYQQGDEYENITVHTEKGTCYRYLTLTANAQRFYTKRP